MHNVSTGHCELVYLSELHFDYPYTIVPIVHHLAERLGPEIDMGTFWQLLVALPTYIINEYVTHRHETADYQFCIEKKHLVLGG